MPPPHAAREPPPPRRGACAPAPAGQKRRSGHSGRKQHACFFGHCGCHDSALYNQARPSTECLESTPAPRNSPARAKRRDAPLCPEAGQARLRRRSGTAGIRAPACRSCADRGLAFGRSVSAKRAGSRRRVQAARCPLCGAQWPDYRRTKAQRRPRSPCAGRTAELRAGLPCGGQAGRPAAAGAPSPPPPRTAVLHNQGLPQRAPDSERARVRQLVVAQALRASGRAPAVRGLRWAQDKAPGRHARHPARPVGGYAQRLSQGGARRRKRQYAYSCPLPSPRRPAPPAPQRNLAASARHEGTLHFTVVRRPRRSRRDRAPRSCPRAGT